MEAQEAVAGDGIPATSRDRLLEESALVADLITSALAVLHSSDANVSLIGEFIGLVGITGGVATSVLSAADPVYVPELAKFFAGRLEAAAKVFRRVEAGESVDAVMGTPTTQEEEAAAEAK